MRGTAKNGTRDTGGKGRRIESRRATQLPQLKDHGICKDQVRGWRKLAAILKQRYLGSWHKGNYAAENVRWITQGEEAFMLGPLISTPQTGSGIA